MENIFNEIWKDIEGYEGLYQVSNFGRIKSLNYNRTGKEKIMKNAKNTWGYLFVDISKKGERKAMPIHRLVAKAFLPNPNNLPEVNHKDENKENNAVWNLEWCSKSHNINYGTRNERVAKVFSKPVAQYDLNGNLIKIYPSIMEAQRKTGSNHISSCCNGKRNMSHGYQWKYI